MSVAKYSTPMPPPLPTSCNHENFLLSVEMKKNRRQNLPLRNFEKFFFTISSEHLHGRFKGPRLGRWMHSEDRDFRKRPVQLFGHRHVGQQHELLDQAVAVPSLVQLEALEKKQFAFQSLYKLSKGYNKKSPKSP